MARRSFRWVLLILIAFVSSAGACKDPPPPQGSGALLIGIRTVLPTTPNPTLSGGQDETLQGLTGLSATISRIDVVHRTIADDPSTEKVITVDSTSHDVQLLGDLSDASTRMIAYLTVPVGYVMEVRFISSDVTIALRGTTYEVKVPSGPQTGLKMDPIDGVPFQITNDERTGARVVFNPFESLIRNHGQAVAGDKGNGKAKGNASTAPATAVDGGFMLKPEVLAEHISIIDLSPILLDRVIIGFKQGLSMADINATNAQIGATIMHGFAPSNYYTMHLPASVTLEDALKYYSQSSNVDFTEPDILVYPKGGVTPCNPGFENTPSGAMIQTHFPEAWAETTGSQSVVIAVIDTGFQLDNLSLLPNWYVNSEEFARSQPQVCLDALAAAGQVVYPCLADWDGDEVAGNCAGPADMGDIQEFFQQGMSSMPTIVEAPQCKMYPCPLGTMRPYLTPLDFVGLDACNGFIRGVQDSKTKLANDMFGYNFGMGNWTAQNPVASVNAHGTAVAGILGGAGTTNCSAATLPAIAGANWNVRLLPVAIANSAGKEVNFYSNMMEALRYAGHRGADIISVSMGTEITRGPLPPAAAALVNDPISSCKGVITNAGAKFESLTTGYQKDLASALKNDVNGALVVGATDNCPLNDDDTANTFDYWANGPMPNTPNVIAVGGTDTDAISKAAVYSPQSAFGPKHIDIAAPRTMHVLLNGSWGTLTGNSLATPLVAGVAGLLLAKDPLLPHSDLKAHILCAAQNQLDAAKVNSGNFLDAYGTVHGTPSCSPP